MRQANCIDDVLNAVVDAQSRYNIAHKDSKAGKWLRKLSSRVWLYGNIIDVLVQQHPEYVSLAWGAMKFLFVVSAYFTPLAYELFADTSQLVVNHEAMTKSLAKCLSQIADSLPRIEFSSVIYPTQRMMQTVAELYGYILRFLIRAQDWYQESTFKHVLHSLTRPVELRYKDVINDITSCTLSMESLASAGAQAEQRDMHFKLQQIIKRQKDSDAVLLDLRQTISGKLRQSCIVLWLTDDISLSIYQHAVFPLHGSTTFGLTNFTNYGFYHPCPYVGCYEKPPDMRFHET